MYRIQEYSLFYIKVINYCDECVVLDAITLDSPKLYYAFPKLNLVHHDISAPQTSIHAPFRGGKKKKN